ncbi:MAG: hypothetical protein ACYDCN_01290 [Bacteroidia bacterium]
MKKLFIAFIVIASAAKQSDAQNQETNTATNFSYGLKTNFSLSNRLDPLMNNFYIMDYSLYLQYKRVGVLAGFSYLDNITHKKYDRTYSYMNGFNLGLIFKLAQFKKNSALNLYIYDTHYSMLNADYNPNPPHGSGTNSLFYKTNYNFYTLNLRYKKTFFKGIFSAEFGVFATLVYGREVYHEQYAYPMPGSSGVADIFIGETLSLSLNVSALFTKNSK